MMEISQAYRNVFDYNPVATLIIDKQGNIVLSNEQALELFGYRKNELIGKNTLILVPERFIGNHTSRLEEYFIEPRILSIGVRKSFWTLKNDGTEFEAEIGLYPFTTEGETYMVATVKNVTEKKANERYVWESERHYRRTLDNMLEGAQIVGFDWNYLYVNDAFVKHSRYSREMLLSHTVLELYPGIEHTAVYPVYLKCFNERVPILMENEFLFPDGTMGWFDLSFQPVPEGVFILSIDISERKKAEMELTAKNRMLQRMNEELEQFAYIASHDLQEPLRTLNSFAELIQSEYSGRLDQEGEKYLDFILKSSDRMKQLVEGLLNYSRIGRVKELVLVDANEVVSEVILDLSSSIRESGAEIITGSLPVVSVYPMEFRLLIQNLLSNAIKFSRENIPPRIMISAKMGNNAWQFSIADNGIGVDMKYKDKIFVIFRRLHNVSEYDGTGIGLAFCKKIVELHQGTIWVESRPNEGSVFNFIIPIL